MTLPAAIAAIVGRALAPGRAEGMAKLQFSKGAPLLIKLNFDINSNGQSVRDYEF